MKTTLPTNLVYTQQTTKSAVSVNHDTTWRQLDRFHMDQRSRPTVEFQLLLLLLLSFFFLQFGFDKIVLSRKSSRRRFDRCHMDNLQRYHYSGILIRSKICTFFFRFIQSATTKHPLKIQRRHVPVLSFQHKSCESWRILLRSSSIFSIYSVSIRPIIKFFCSPQNY